MKILIASPVATHPPDEGNRNRILQLARMMRVLGHDVHFAYLPNRHFRAGNVGLMREFWGGRLHLFKSDSALVSRAINKLLSHVNKLPIPSALRSRVPLLSPQIRDIDDPFANIWLLQFPIRFFFARFDIVIVEYVFFSRLLTVFASQTRKIIDTHDIFSGRHERILSADPNAQAWLSATTSSESAAFDRADCIIAIQDDEAKVIRSMTSRDVSTVGHVPDTYVTSPSLGNACQPTITLIGSNNVLNVQGCVWFINKVMPLVMRAVPTVSLRIVGSIGKAIVNHVGEKDFPDKSIVCVGLVDDLATEYELAHVVINPVLNGTGLPIKTVEALAYGKAVVCTTSGARGVVNDVDRVRPCYVADDPNEFAKALVNLLHSAEERETLARRGIRFLDSWRKNNLDQLEGALSQRHVHG